MTVRLMDVQPCPTCGGSGKRYAGSLSGKLIEIGFCDDCRGTGETATPVTCAGCRWIRPFRIDGVDAVTVGQCGAEVSVRDFPAGGRYVLLDFGCLSWAAKGGTDGNG